MKRAILPILTSAMVMSHDQLDAYFAPLFQEPERRDRSIDATLKRAKERKGKPAWDRRA